jgi:nucleotide-binding universal stress UspA family protein
VYGSIVVGTDGSPAARAAVRAGLELLRPGGEGLAVVCAYAPAARAEAEATLEAAASVAHARGVPVRTYAREGDPADAILDVAEERGADLVVVGHRGLTGARRFLLGSVPHRVSHHAPCSVLIVRTG